MIPQLTIPEAGNKYYNTKRNGGINPCIQGNPRTRNKGLDVLPNCVGYATGRFNEIVGVDKCQYLGNRNAAQFVELARSQGLTVTDEPTLGGCMVWSGGTGGYGHVAIVEIKQTGFVITSESEYYGKAFVVYKRSGEQYDDGCYWMDKSYKYLGCINNPAIREEETVDYQTFCAYMSRWLAELAEKPADAWAQAAIDRVVETGIMVGDPDGNFRAQSPLKREELAQILSNVLLSKL